MLSLRGGRYIVEGERRRRLAEIIPVFHHETELQFIPGTLRGIERCRELPANLVQGGAELTVFVHLLDGYLPPPNQGEVGSVQGAADDDQQHQGHQHFQQGEAAMSTNTFQGR